MITDEGAGFDVPRHHTMRMGEGFSRKRVSFLGEKNLSPYVDLRGTNRTSQRHEDMMTEGVEPPTRIRGRQRAVRGEAMRRWAAWCVVGGVPAKKDGDQR